MADDSTIVTHDEPAARSRTNYILRLSLAAAGLPGRYEQMWTRTKDKVSFELCGCLAEFRGHMRGYGAIDIVNEHQSESVRALLTPLAEEGLLIWVRHHPDLPR